MTSAPDYAVQTAALTIIPGREAVGANRIEISPTARLRFDEVMSSCHRIKGTLLAATATRVAIEQADAALAEIEMQARAARLALKRGR